MIDIKLLATLSGHQNPIFTAENSQKAGILFTAGNDRGVVEWSLKSMSFIKVMFPVRSSVYSLHCPAGAPLLIAGERNGQVDVFDFREQKVTHMLQHHKLPVFDIKTVPSKNELLLSSEDGIVSVWDLLSMQILYSFKVCATTVRVISISPNEKTVAFGCKDNIIRIYRLDDYSLISELDQHTLPVTSLQFSPDGKFLLSGSRDAQLKIWNTSDFTLYENVAAHLFSIYSIAFHPKLPFFATASRDKSIKIWNAEDFSLKKTLSIEKGYEMHRLSVNKVLWDTENRLISVGDDKMVKVWEVTQQLTSV
ncbi:MAG: WD40 repeat domain-containing protein [Daejeonella sp.]|uniref:WD40 repeat domain-containing protein n=1 Tax=Daejeonella sp. TaxID=2805397 RepID=UPI003C745E1C